MYKGVVIVNVKRKLIALLLVVSLSVTLIGCTKKNQQTNEVETEFKEWGVVIGKQNLKTNVMSGAYLYKIQDKQTNDIVYVLVGGDGRGGITVVKQ